MLPNRQYLTAVLISAALLLAAVCSITILAAAFNYQSPASNNPQKEMVVLPVQPLDKIVISADAKVLSRK